MVLVFAAVLGGFLMERGNPYADFVTAMVALFIVMWMMSATEKVKASTSGYFRDPRGYSHKRGAGPAGAGEGLVQHRQTAGDLQKEIEQALTAASAPTVLPVFLSRAAGQTRIRPAPRRARSRTVPVHPPRS
jgi:flagellar motor protein MotB